MTGSMRERAPGVWMLRVFLQRDAAGKQQFLNRTFRGGKRAASRALAELVIEADKHRVTGPGPGSMDALLDRWFAWADQVDGTGSRRLSSNTLKTYRGYRAKWITPIIGHLPVERVSGSDLNVIYGRMADAGLSSATIRQVHSIVRRSFVLARRWGLYDGPNPAGYADPPGLVRGEIRPPGTGLVRELVAAANKIGPDAGVFVQLAAATGARRAELVGLQWGDVHDGAVRFQRTIHVLGRGQYEAVTTKTRATRSMTIDDATTAALEAERARRAALHTAGGLEPVWVFESPSGDPWTPDHASVVWNRVRKAVPAAAGVRLHDLRHWNLTELLNAGVDLATVAGRAGHASGNVTVAIYSHRTGRTDRAAANVIGGVLGTGGVSSEQQPGTGGDDERHGEDGDVEGPADPEATGTR